MITKRMIIMLAIVGFLFGGVFAYKAFTATMAKKYRSFQAPPSIVTALTVSYEAWQPELTAVGSLRAVKGVDVTSEVAGLVRKILFRSGDEVAEGAVLVELNADADLAQLKALEAAADLARTTYERDKKQFDIQAVSQATLDSEAADLRSKEAQVEQQRALVLKKTIRAPFTGRLGITTVNPGQYLNPGDKIVTLQELDRLYADFLLPQQELSRIGAGQTVRLSTDTYPGKTFTGTVATINPKVDPDTRNFQVEAVVANPGRKLLPGMYASVSIHTGAAERHLTVPQTAVTYNPYGDTVFLVRESAGPDGKPALTAQQNFVTTGPKRGDQVAILSGVAEGDRVVTSGQMKLRNGSPLTIDNTVQPSNDPAPQPKDE